MSKITYILKPASKFKSQTDKLDVERRKKVEKHTGPMTDSDWFNYKNFLIKKNKE